MNNNNSFIVVSCPHCNLSILIYEKEFNCKIFRHGVYKNNHEQIPPHLNKQECDRLIENKLIYGCGKPFLLKKNNSTIIAQKCDYL